MLFVHILCFRLGLAERQWRSASAWVLAILGRAQVVVCHLVARNGVLVMERHHPRIWPEHRVIAQLVRPIWIVGVCGRQKRNIIGLGVRPALLKGRVPERKVFQAENFPDAILFDVLVLVDAAFPPLYKTSWVGVLDAVVGTRRHHAAEAALCAGALVVHVDNALDLGVVEQETVYGTIAASDKSLREAANVEPLHALFAIVATTEEFDARICVVGVELSDLPSLAMAIKNASGLRRILPLCIDTCQGSIRTCTGAFELPLGLDGYSSA